MSVIREFFEGEMTSMLCLLSGASFSGWHDDTKELAWLLRSSEVLCDKDVVQFAGSTLEVPAPALGELQTESPSIFVKSENARSK